MQVLTLAFDLSRPLCAGCPGGGREHADLCLCSSGNGGRLPPRLPEAVWLHFLARPQTVICLTAIITKKEMSGEEFPGSSQARNVTANVQDKSGMTKQC